jgi:hypothetical protein
VGAGGAIRSFATREFPDARINRHAKGRSEGRCGQIRLRITGLRYLSSSASNDDGLDEFWSPECTHDGAGLDDAGLGVAQLEVGAGASACSASGAAGRGAAGLGARGAFFAGLFLAVAFLAPAFLADFFGAAAFDFLADFFADFFADLVALFADFFADFFDDFFAVFFFAVTALFLLLLLFLPAFFFLPLAIMILLLPPIHVPGVSSRPPQARGQCITSILAGDRLSPNREAQSCAPQELTYRRQSAPCIQCCPQQSCPV